jgi:hypothetical protein
MKIQKRSNKPIILTVVAVIIVILGGYTAFAAYSHNWPFKNAEDSSKSQDKTSDSDSGKTAGDSDYQPTNTNNPDKTPPQYDTPKTDEPQKPTISGVINYKSVMDDRLSIRVTIDQKINSGICDLKLTRNSPKKSVTKSAEVLANPSSATCKGFDIPVSELGSGTWNIIITVTSGDKKGDITGQVSL